MRAVGAETAEGYSFERFSLAHGHANNAHRDKPEGHLDYRPAAAAGSRFAVSQSGDAHFTMFLASHSVWGGAGLKRFSDFAEDMERMVLHLKRNPREGATRAPQLLFGTPKGGW